MKRLFIATPIITLSEEVQELVAQLKFQLRHDDIVWVKDNVKHLTLRFIGATPSQQIPLIKKSLEESCKNFSQFSLTLNKIGVFGSRYQPKVIWLGFKEFNFFRALFEDLELRLRDCGIEPNNGNFVPHITLGRVKSTHSKEKFWKCIEEFSNQKFSQDLKISQINLYQSFLNKDGPEYKVLYTRKVY